MNILDSMSRNAIPFAKLGDPKAVREGSERVVLMPSGSKAKMVSLGGQWVADTGTPEYTSDTLPNPAMLPAGIPVVVDGQLLLKKTPTGMVIDGVQSRRVSVSSTRLFGAVGKDTTAGRTAHLIMQAPAHFDAVRINVLSAESAGNAWKITVAPSAKYNILGPVDASNGAITPTVVTFGTTDRRNPRNPGGGAVTVTSTGSSGTAAAHNLIQDRIVSDLIQLKSLDRADFPDRNPLIYLRFYGTNIPLLATSVMADNDANALKYVLGEYYSGYANGDYSLTNPANWSQYGAPCVEIEFLLRGKVVRNIGITGDSTDQGWVDGTVVPQFGATINGYMRRVVQYMRDQGEPVGYHVCAQAGQRSFMTYNNVLPAVISGELTHLVIRPWSVNDTGTGTTASVATDAIQRTNLLIQACKDYGVVPILLRPFAYGTVQAAQLPLIHAYVDSYEASGGLVLDLTSVLNVEGSLQYLKSEWLTVNAGGTVVDQTHLNDAAHQAAADYIINKLLWLFS